MGHGDGMRFAFAAFFVVVAAPIFGAGCPTPVQQTDAGPVDAGDTGPVACADDEQCNGGFCRGGICLAQECRDKSECGADQVCDLDGRCSAPPAECVTAADCPGDDLCDGFTDSCFDPDGPEGEGEGEGEEGEGEGPVGEGEGEGPVGEGEGEGPVGEGEGEPGTGIDLSGFRLENRDPPNQVSVIPDGTFLDVGDVLVIGRKASQADFTTFWGSLGAGAQYLNANTDSGVPVINGDETFALVNPNGGDVDGPSRTGADKKCYARTAASAGSDGSWAEAATTEATPGVVSAPAVHGLVISEWCDAEGSGNFKFEFIEIANLP